MCLRASGKTKNKVKKRMKGKKIFKGKKTAVETGTKWLKYS